MIVTAPIYLTYRDGSKCESSMGLICELELFRDVGSHFKMCADAGNNIGREE